MNNEIKKRLEKIEQGVVPEGYKETEIGIIPNDWEVKRLGEVFDVYGGESIPRNKLGGIGYPYLHYGDIHVMNKTSIDINATLGLFPKYDIPKEDVKEGALIEDGDIVFADASEDYADIGKAVVVKNKTKVPFISGLHTIIGKDKEDLFNIEFKRYLFSIYKIKKEFKFYATGTSVLGITQENIKKILIYIPFLQEQEKIAEILSTWDKAIERIDQLIYKKEIQKKGLMQQLLTGEIRLHGFTEKWKQVRLGDVTNRVTEKNNGKSENVLTISAQHGLINQEKYFTKQIASKNLDNYTYLSKGDFAYNKSYSKGYPMGAIKVLEFYGEGVVSSLYICFRAERNIYKDYLEQYFDANMFAHEVFKIAQEGARNHGLLNIGIKDFFSIKLIIPPLPEQKAIAEILSTADREIELLNELLSSKKEEKKGLMQLLLTGIVRV